MPDISIVPFARQNSRADLVAKKTLRALDDTDGMNPALRKCVHEFGYEIVSVIMQNGVTNPNKIRNIVVSCWMGPRNNNNRLKNNSQGSSVGKTLDALLINIEAKISVATLVRYLALNHMVIVPREPSAVMVDASIDAVNHLGRVTKREKHHYRLKQAIEASCKKLWPQL